jgi:methionyl-tRNA formyltransferase
MPLIRVVFMGTAALARPSLQALIDAPSYTVIGVVTQPDKPKGRALKQQPSPVKLLALDRQLKLWQPRRAREPDFVESLRGLNLDLIVVAAYGQILPPAILDLPHFGCLNVHTSLLPKYRGAAPIQWALVNGDQETGVTIMKMDAGLDTGPILSQVRETIRSGDDSETLHDRLAVLGAGLLVRTIPDYVSGKITPHPQPSGEATEARKITKEDGRIDWTQPARVLQNRIRAFRPWPGAFTYLTRPPRKRLLKIWKAEVNELASGPAGEILPAERHEIIVGCGQGSLRVLSLQLEGSKPLEARQFLSGHALKPGEQLG